MSGFEAWAATFPATLAIAGCMLAVGVALGWLWATMPRGVSRRERRELADRAADRAARQFRRLREPAAVGQPGKNGSEGAGLVGLRPSSSLPSPRRRTSTAAFLDPTPYGAVMFAAVAPELAHEWEPAHVGQALAIANGDPISTGEIRAITERIDEWLPRLLAEYPVPYPDGDQ